MSWVPLVTVEEATSETKNIYDFLQNNWGFVPNYYQALGPYPQLLKDQVDMFTHVMFVERALKRDQRTDRVGRKWNQSLELLPGRASRNSRKARIRQSVR